MRPNYSSRDSFYKTPFGAVSCGTEIIFTIWISRQYPNAQAELVISVVDEVPAYLPMEPAGEDAEGYLFRVHYTPESSGLYYYFFQIKQNDQLYFIRCSNDHTGVLSADTARPPYQLTVYAQDFRTPEIKGSVMYQIFPDRFFCGGSACPALPADRILRSDWGGMPFFLPTPEGKVLNNDYFGGNLKGIQEKLPYLQSLGVSLLYLNPIFEAHSNHRYNTADYKKIDPLLGTEEDFIELCRTARSFGLRIILDGVFSHTGSDSLYFNKTGRYGTHSGAYQDPESQYRPWYNFIKYPQEYKTWWGFETLPELNKNDPSYIEFICGENGVLRYWLDRGAAGFRLDVADELPDAFIERIRATVKAHHPENLLIGEVWEDASNKESYGVKRRYLLGSELDSTMNYPFRDAILTFFQNRDGAYFANWILGIVENYPQESLHIAMNSLSTHDTERILTMLAGEDGTGKDRSWQSHHVLTKAQYKRGVQLLKIAMALQFTLPGIPCIYYGDEAGMQGYRDPFNRACYPWGHPDQELLRFTAELSSLRRNSPALARGSIRFLCAEPDCIAYLRQDGEYKTLIGVNLSETSRSLSLSPSEGIEQALTIPPCSFKIL